MSYVLCADTSTTNMPFISMNMGTTMNYGMHSFRCDSKPSFLNSKADKILKLLSTNEYNVNVLGKSLPKCCRGRASLWQVQWFWYLIYIYVMQAGITCNWCIYKSILIELLSIVCQTCHILHTNIEYKCTCTYIDACMCNVISVSAIMCAYIFICLNIWIYTRSCS